MARDSGVFVWADRAVFVGDSNESALHSHHAIEIEISLDGSRFDFGVGEGQSVQGVLGAVLRADVAHRVETEGPKVAVLFFDPMAPAGQGLTDWLGERTIAPLPDDSARTAATSFRILLNEKSGLEEARVATNQVLEALGVRPTEAIHDARVVRVIAFLEENLDNPPSTDSICALINVSERRLRDLFRQHTGLPIRRYLLWLRLRQALVAALAGTSMTNAAHDAGFSDAAHFTRTCQMMFGLPPTAFAPTDAVFIG